METEETVKLSEENQKQGADKQPTTTAEVKRTIIVKKKPNDDTNLIDLCFEKIGDLDYPRGCRKRAADWVISFPTEELAFNAHKYLSSQFEVCEPKHMDYSEIETEWLAKWRWRLRVTNVTKNISDKDLMNHFEPFLIKFAEIHKGQDSATIYFENIEEWNRAKKQYAQTITKANQKSQIFVAEPEDLVIDPKYTKVVLTSQNGWLLPHKQIEEVFRTNFRVRTHATTTDSERKFGYGFAYILTNTYDVRFKNGEVSFQLPHPTAGTNVEWKVESFEAVKRKKAQSNPPPSPSHTSPKPSVSAPSSSQSTSVPRTTTQPKTIRVPPNNMGNVNVVDKSDAQRGVHVDIGSNNMGNIDVHIY